LETSHMNHPASPWAPQVPWMLLLQTSFSSVTSVSHEHTETQVFQSTTLGERNGRPSTPGVA
jgi:hypothetical protein